MSKLLVVDDEERIRSMIRKYGEFEGHEIEEAVDGMDAIEKCKQAEYDLIIMDIMMPRMDGIRATLKSREAQYSDHYSVRKIRGCGQNSGTEHRRG